MNKKIYLIGAILSLISLILIIPMISAYNGYGGYGYGSSPLDYFDNQWVRFGIIFFLLFALIFFAVNKTFKNNAIAGIVAVGVSLLISLAVAQKGLLYSYTGDAIGNIAILVGILISIFALFNVLIANFGAPTGVIVGIITTLIFGSFVDLNELLPYGILSGPLGNIFEILNNILGAFIGPVIIIGGFVLFWSLFSRTARRRREMRRVYGH